MITRKMCTGKDELKKKPSDGDRALAPSPGNEPSSSKDEPKKKPSDGDSAPCPGNEPSNLEHSADRSDKSGDKGKPHWLKWVGAAASAVTFFSIFVGGGWELYKYHHPEPHEASRAIRKMKELKVPFKEPKHFIQRKAVEEKIHDELYENPKCYTTIIAGQRGVGKTTSVLSCFKEEPGVVYISGMRTNDAVFKKILQVFDIEVKTRDAMLLLQRILENIEHKGCKPPVFVIDISEAWTSEDFTNFLIATKQLGADLKLTRFLLVVSSELSSYRVPICYTDLRCEIFYVPEATEKEAKQFLLKSISSLKNASGEKLVPENEEDHMVKIALDCADRRFLSLSQLFKNKMIYSSKQDLKEQFLEKKRLTLLYRNRLLGEVLNDLNITKKSSRGFQVLNELSNGTEIGTGQFQSEYGYDFYDRFCESNHKWRPHPFVIDVVGEKVRVSSAMVSEVLQKRLAQLPK